MTLPEEFVDQLYDYLVSDEAQAKIKIICQQKDVGNLSRLFNDMTRLSVAAKKEALVQITQAATKNQLKLQLSLTVHNMTKTLVNQETTDLTEDAKQKIGIENYRKLLTLCNDDPKKLVNYFLQATTALYALAITEQQNDSLGAEEISNEHGKMIVDKATKGSLSETQHQLINAFQKNIYVPISNYTTGMTSDFFKDDVQENMIATDELKRQYTEWRNVIQLAVTDLCKFSENYPLTQQESDGMRAIIKVFEMNRDELDTYCCKFEANMSLMEKECADKLEDIALSLVGAMRKVPDLAIKYTKKKWVDKFWDLVSWITKRDLKTQSSRNVELYEALIDLHQIPAKVTSSKDRKRKRTDSTPESIDEPIEPKDDNTLDSRT